MVFSGIDPDMDFRFPTGNYRMDSRNVTAGFASDVIEKTQKHTIYSVLQ
jgi:hypothetical protein